MLFQVKGIVVNVLHLLIVKQKLFGDAPTYVQPIFGNLFFFVFQKRCLKNQFVKYNLNLPTSPFFQNLNTIKTHQSNTTISSRTVPDNINGF